jgi:BlaI family penicillinase repressor
MKKIPKISESEWEVMRALWIESPLTANKIVEKLTATTHWKATTIRTLINRLVEKSVVGYEKKGREYHYYPLLAETECVRAESRSFLRRVYRGALNPILSAFIENEELSPEDIKALERILQKKGKRK